MSTSFCVSVHRNAPFALKRLLQKLRSFEWIEHMQRLLPQRYAITTGRLLSAGNVQMVVLGVVQNPYLFLATKKPLFWRGFDVAAFTLASKPTPCCGSGGLSGSNVHFRKHKEGLYNIFLMIRFEFGVWVLCIVLGLLVIWIGAAVFLTDPYFTWSLVSSPYHTRVEADGTITVVEVIKPTFTQSILARLTAYARAGVRIVLYRWIPEPSLGNKEAEVLAKLHQKRFDPTQPYVITGAHYSDLYVRNLGIFFNELVTPGITPSTEDLQNRQRIALQTVSLDLAFLRANKKLVTTVVPLGGTHFTGVNIYAEPSDALHAILFTLRQLREYPATRPAAEKLLQENRAQLQAELQRYISFAVDPQTQVVRKDVVLSGARDGVKREAAFFDTVIAWKTVVLAQELDVLDAAVWPDAYRSLLDTNRWKETILTTYWQNDTGFFANDLNGSGEFGGDSLVAFSTGFLDTKKPADAEKLAKITHHIQNEKLDQPFPLRYSRSNTQNDMHLAVKLFAPGYMGEGIWSHWGMEYIKALIALSETELPLRCEYRQQAKKFLDLYAKNIETSGGYPELYGKDGKPFKTPAVRAVLHSGWVVNYEAAQMRLKTASSIPSCQF